MAKQEFACEIGKGPVHVVHLVESFAAGCFTALNTICAAVGDGFTHTVIHGMRPETPVNFAELFPAGVHFHYLPMRRGVSPWADLRAFAALPRLLRRYAPQVLHCHSSKAGFLGRMAAYPLGLPCVYTPHGYAFLRTDVGAFARFCFKTAERAAALTGNAFAACGHEEYELSRTLARKGSPVVCIPNAVDVSVMEALARSRSNTAASSGKRVQVGTCGRPDASRAPELFAATATALHDAAHWVWIGARADTDCLPPSVERTGWLSHEAALDRMADLDIYVQTSRWDGLSFSVLEAMSLGKPVICTDIPAARAVVRHNVTGFLADSAQALAKYAASLIADADLRRRMGEAARRYVQEHHDVRRVYTAYADMYRSLAARGAGL